MQPITECFFSYTCLIVTLAIHGFYKSFGRYCYVLKLLFLIPQLYFPNQAATSIYSEVLALLRSTTRPCTGLLQF